MGSGVPGRWCEALDRWPPLVYSRDGPSDHRLYRRHCRPALCQSGGGRAAGGGGGFQPPSPGVLVEVVEGLRSALFPGYFGLVQMTEGLRFHVGSILEEKLRHLQEQIVRGLVFAQWSQWQGAGSPE